MGMHGYGLISSPQVVAAFDLGRYRRLVDLGGATGHLAIAACQHYPDLRASSSTCPRPSRWPGRSSGPRRWRIASRSSPATSSRMSCPRPTCSPSAASSTTGRKTKVLALLKRIFDRLPAGGALLIAEKLLDDDKRGPLWAQMQSLGMLLYTEGKERTVGEYEALLEQVGFAEVRGAKTPSPLDAVLAVKA